LNLQSPAKNRSTESLSRRCPTENAGRLWEYRCSGRSNPKSAAGKKRYRLSVPKRDSINDGKISRAGSKRPAKTEQKEGLGKSKKVGRGTLRSGRATTALGEKVVGAGHSTGNEVSVWGWGGVGLVWGGSGGLCFVWLGGFFFLMAGFFWDCGDWGVGFFFFLGACGC